jgi:excisionase family DNA binding protein
MPRATRPPRRFTSIEAAATYADVSTRTINRWIADGLLRAYRLGPRLVKIDLADLDQLARPIRTAGASDG